MGGKLGIRLFRTIMIVPEKCPIIPVLLTDLQARLCDNVTTVNLGLWHLPKATEADVVYVDINVSSNTHQNN